MGKEIRNYQSPYTATSLIDHLAGRNLTVCVCWLLTLTDGTKIGATSCTHDLTLPGIAGVTFRSNGGAAPTAVDAEAGQSSAGLEIEAVLDDALVTEAKIAAGDLDDAVFEIMRVNYKVLDMGQIIDFSGVVGEIRTEGPRFVTEARPKSTLASLKIGRVTRARCDVVHFADLLLENRCKLSRAATAPDGLPFQVTSTVTTGGQVDEFVDSARTETATDHFEEVEFTSGVLNGRKFEVRKYDPVAKKFYLQVSASQAISTGVGYKALRRCRRREEDCIAYANMINFRGYSKITNIEEFNRIVRAR